MKTTFKYLAVITLVSHFTYTNFFLTKVQIIDNYSFSFKEAMVKLQDIENAVVVGGVSKAFRLYNNYIPVLDPYVYRYVLNNRQTLIKGENGEIDGLLPEYTVVSQYSLERMDAMETRGYVFDRMLIEGTERGVGNIALLRFEGIK